MINENVTQTITQATPPPPLEQETLETAGTEKTSSTADTPVLPPITNTPIPTAVSKAVAEGPQEMKQWNKGTGTGLTDPDLETEIVKDTSTNTNEVLDPSLFPPVLNPDGKPRADSPYSPTDSEKDVLDKKAEQEVAAEEAKTQEELRVIEAKRIRDIMSGNLEDPNTFLAERELLQKYTMDNSFIKDSNGNVILDAQGNPQEDVSLTMDPRYYQLEAARLAEAVQAGTMTVLQAKEAAAASFSASLIDIDSLSKNIDKIAELEPMKAASMSSHLNELLEGMEEGVIPLWARPAVTKVEQALSGRGLSASSIGRDSLFNAIIQAAVPIAQQDATFEQEANKSNYDAKVNAIFEDTKIEAAAKQFNAKSINEANALKAQLQTQVSMANAERVDKINQFNAQEYNTNSRFNSEQANTLEKFNVEMSNQREQFNINMAAQINGATVQWRRQMNSANTAGINAVNQANVQQAFNLSNQALSNLWQEQRDTAHWMFQATENEKDRRAQLEATVLARESSTASEIGGFLEGLDIDYDKIADGVSDVWSWITT